MGNPVGGRKFPINTLPDYVPSYTYSIQVSNYALIKMHRYYSILDIINGSYDFVFPSKAVSYGIYRLI